MTYLPTPIAANKLLDDYVINISNQGGGDCGTWAEAKAIRQSITSVTVRVKILFSAGEKHLVDNSSAGLTDIPDNTEIGGEGGLLGTTIEFTDNTKDGFVLGSNCNLRNLILQYSTVGTSGTALVKFSASGGTNVMEWIYFNTTDVGVRITSGDVTVHECFFISAVNYGVIGDGGSGKIVDCQFSGNIRGIQGNIGSVLFLKNFQILAASDAGIYQNGGTIQTEGGSLLGNRDGINVASGAFTTQGVYLAGQSRYDINQSTSSGIPIIQSTYADTSKFNISLQALFIVDNCLDINHIGTDHQRQEHSASGPLSAFAKYNSLMISGLTMTLPDCSTYTIYYPITLYVINETSATGSYVQANTSASNSLNGGTATLHVSPDQGHYFMGYQGKWRRIF